MKQVPCTHTYMHPLNFHTHSFSLSLPSSLPTSFPRGDGFYPSSPFSIHFHTSLFFCTPQSMSFCFTFPLQVYFEELSMADHVTLSFFVTLLHFYCHLFCSDLCHLFCIPVYLAFLLVIFYM